MIARVIAAEILLVLVVFYPLHAAILDYLVSWFEHLAQAYPDFDVLQRLFARDSGLLLLALPR